MNINDLAANNNKQMKIIFIHRDELAPDPKNPRGDMSAQNTLENIERIRKSMLVNFKGKPRGIHQPLAIRQASLIDGKEKHLIIAGECRWRASENVPDELKLLPCIVFNDDDQYLRFIQNTENQLRAPISLLQTANAIFSDLATEGVTEDDIVIMHGLRNKAHLSAYKTLIGLSDNAKKLVEEADFKDTNLIAKIKKIDKEGPEAIRALRQKIKSGITLQRALKKVTPELEATESEVTSENNESISEPTKSTTSDFVKFKLPLDVAKAFAVLNEISLTGSENAYGLSVAIENLIKSQVAEQAENLPDDPLVGATDD